MISDTLDEAAATIRRYLAAFPNTYARDRKAIEALLVVMDGVRKRLDTPPAEPAKNRRRS